MVGHGADLVDVRPTALVCDDDPVLRRYVGCVLEAHGWDATEAATAYDALDLADALHPDVVVLDVALSGMSGLEAIPRINASCPSCRVVALSSFDTALEPCLRAGAVAVLTKVELGRLDDVLAELEPGHAA